MKEFVKAYVNGKKAAILIAEDGEAWYLHNVKSIADFSDFDGYKKRDAIPPKRCGFYCGTVLRNSKNIKEAITEIADRFAFATFIEGTQEYTNIENNGRRTKRAKEQPKKEEEQPKQEAPRKEEAPKPHKSNEVRDPNFDLIVKAIKRNRNVYLWGPAGSGKTTIARQVAEELGLPFYCQGIVNDKFEFEGSQDPRNGSDGYLPSTFYKAFTTGGVYCLDEIDGCDPGQLSFLNAALANRVANFPVIGTVKAHPNFRFIATGNTNGFGPTEMYMTRFAFDSATVDRFNDVIRIDYNRKVERAAARGNMEVVDFIHDLRKVLNEIKNGQIVCGYRMIGNLAEAVDTTEFGEALYTARQAVEFSVMRGIEGDMVRMIAGQIKDSDNQFTRALKEYARVAI